MTRTFIRQDVQVFSSDVYDDTSVPSVVNVAQGISAASGKTRPIGVGVNDGVVESTAGDLMVKATAKLLFDDLNQTGSTWAQDGIKLSESTANTEAPS